MANELNNMKDIVKNDKKELLNYIKLAIYKPTQEQYAVKILTKDKI